MPVSARWYNDAKTAVYVEFSDPWTLTELSTALKQSRALMSSVDYSVDAIWDSSKTSGMPKNILSHFMVSNADTDIPDNQRAVVVIVHGMFLQSFAGMAKRLLPRITKNMHITSSLQDADKKLRSLRV